MLNIFMAYYKSAKGNILPMDRCYNKSAVITVHIAHCKQCIPVSRLSSVKRIMGEVMKIVGPAVLVVALGIDRSLSS